MMSRIHLELDELRRADARLQQAIEQLREHQRYVQQQAESLLANWKGVSAESLQRQMQQFSSEIAVRIRRLEERRQELSRYIHTMEQADRNMIS